MAQVAAPRVLKVAAEPAQLGEPDKCAASSEPMDNVEPKPKPESTCPAVSTRMVFFWRKSRPLSLIPSAYTEPMSLLAR